MNVKRITLAVASLTLMSTASAYAAGISANVGPIGAGVGVGPLGAGAGINVGGIGAGVNVGTGLAQPALLGIDVLTQPAVINEAGTTVLSYPATYTGACPTACANPCAPRTGFLGGLFSRRHTLLDVSAFGLGAKLGGYGPNFYGPSLLGSNAIIYPSGNTIAGAGLTGCGLSTMSAVIPTTYATGGGLGLNGQRVGNPWLDLSLWRFGFKAGVVNPNWDMRSVGMY